MKYYPPQLPERLRDHFKDERTLYTLEGPVGILETSIHQAIDSVDTLDGLADMADTMKTYIGRAEPYIKKLQEVKLKRLLNQVSEADQEDINYALEEGKRIKWVKEHE